MRIGATRAAITAACCGAVVGLANLGTAVAQIQPPQPPLFPTAPASSTPVPLKVQAPPPRPAAPIVQAPSVILPVVPQAAPTGVPRVTAPAAAVPDVVTHVDERTSVPLWLILLAIASVLVNLCGLGLYLYRRYGFPWDLGGAEPAVAD